MATKDDNNTPHRPPADYSCEYHIAAPAVAFKLVDVPKGSHYTGNKTEQHTIVFLLEGELEFAYNEYQGSVFRAGDIFFLPQAVEMYGTILRDAHMLVLSFDDTAEWVCQKCALSNVSEDYQSTDFRFEPLPLAPALREFAGLVETYIREGFRCTYLHRLKQQELFMLIRCCYSQKEMIRFFYPLIGRQRNFQSKVFAYYREGLSVQDFADHFHMAPKSFTRRFKAEFGTTVYQWMLKQKANRIKLKLSIPGTTFADIIQDFQFADMSHFSKFCKGNFGCTPKELTAQLRNNSTIR